MKRVPTKCLAIPNGDFNATGGGSARTGINSVGMWIYATSYAEFANQVIFSRNYSGTGPIRTDYFHAIIKPDGILQVTSAVTDYSTTNIATTKPYPLNEWVYIQVYQSGNLYKIGWKSASDENVQEKVFARGATLKADRFNNFLFNNPSACARVKEFFWQPGINMFELMNNYNAKAKEIFQVRQYFTLDTRLVQELINAIQGISTTLTTNDFDVYIDTNGVVYVADITIMQ
ncbi:hypothetical protein [Helicobacter valdiviensis]|uniref:hypothetical protein n=1 Tax=Helicobacter valdiviensis TaxID=1458358 RepID=UPI0011B7A737|nr:hypothetical protein [Helicobacter valdiviensis]